MKRQYNPATQLHDHRTDEDRISALPNPILHHILTFLPSKDATRTSALSKFWNQIWKSFLVLEFDKYAFNATASPSEVRRQRKKFEQNFCYHVNRSINGRTGITSIQKFRLAVCFKRCANTRNGDITRWLHYAIYKYVKTLSLTYHNTARATNGWQYVVPQSLFNAQSLESLELFGCQFAKYLSSHAVAFTLRTLILTHVQTDQETLHHVFSNCSLLKELTIEHCKGFGIVTIVAPHLRYLKLYLDRQDDQVVAVEASQLQSLSYAGGYSNVRESIVLSRCFDNLKRLTLHDVDVTDDFLSIMTRIPKIEKLELMRCCFINNLRIKNENLVEISIFQCVRLKNIELQTGRLRSFKFA